MKRAIVAAVLALSTPVSAEPFNRSAWIADFEQMKEAITRNSPNLEWAAVRGLDLPAVERRARTRLAAATNDAAARSALDRFIRNFADGHMELTWPSPPPPATAAAPTKRSTCAELGYRSEPDDNAVASRLPGYTAVGLRPGQARAGVVRVEGRTLGVLRIPLFEPSGDVCAAALTERGVPLDAPCDNKCADAVSRRADALFLSEIADLLTALAAARADMLLLDVASNGGGNDTSIAVARMIAGADLPTPQMAFVRTAARAKDLAEDEAMIRAGAIRAGPDQRILVRELIKGYADARAQAARPCDLSSLWRGQPAGCSNLVRGSFYAGGVTSIELPSGTPKAEWAEVASSTVRFTYTPGQWTKPVLVLVDGNSASSTELLAAMLQDAKRAVIVGAPTFGAGCGWTMPPQEIVLSHSGGRLAIPDCARFRRDGRNEIDGIEPDVLVGFRQFDTPRQRAERLVARLPAAVNAAVQRMQ